MTGVSEIVIFGIFTGVVILALKTSLGCGLTNLRKREVVYVASIYLCASVILSQFVDVIPLDVTQNVLASGLTMHIIVASGLIYSGIITKKEWLSRGKDISRKTFLWLSLPCPVCLLATFLACSVLSKIMSISNLAIGVLVGMIFFVIICAFSLTFAKIAASINIKNPSSLGTAMIMFGLFYFLSILLIPAYVQIESVPVPESTIDTRDTGISLLVMVSLIGLGIIIDRMKRRRMKEVY